MNSPDADSSFDGENTIAANGNLPNVPPLDSREARRVGDYELVEEIARGGMGIVYRAKQRSLNRIVAVKVIRHAKYAGDQERFRFRSEAEAAANLDHPNIVPIYEVGEHDGEPFFSMRLIDGESLAESMRLGRWPIDQISTLRRAAALTATVARAVHAAHQSGILHRDLKPGNILLDKSETPFVTDFGLAKRVESQTPDLEMTDVTQTGQIIGTPAFMSPEQAEGKKGLTTASDIYSLGTILYTLLARRTPFLAQSPLELLQQVVSRQAPALRKANPLVDLDLETICQKCLDKDPEKRYSSALTLAEDLDRWLAGENIFARPIGPIDRTMRWAKRNPMVAVLLTSIIVLLSSIASLAVAFAIRIEEARFQAEQNAVSAQKSFENEVEARKRETEALSQTRGMLVQADIAFGRLFSDRGDHNKALHWIAKAWQDDSQRSNFVDSTERDHRLRVGSELEKLPQLKGICFHESPVVDADFSFDGLHAATLVGDRFVRVWNIELGELSFPPLEHEHKVTHVLYSPDGSRIVTIASGFVHIWNATLGKLERQLKFEENARWAVFTEDSTRILLAGDRTIRGANCVTGEPDELNIACDVPVDFIGLSAQGDKFIAAFIDGTARVFDSASGKPISDFLPQTRRIPDQQWETDEEQFEKRRHRPTFSPDGLQVLTCDDMHVYHWTQGGATKKIPISNERILQLEAFFTPDGKSALAFCRPIPVIYAIDLTSGELDPYHLTSPRQLASVRLAADCPVGAFAVTGGAIYFFSMPYRQQFGPPIGFGKPITSMKFSKNGARLMGASLDGTVRVWETPGSNLQPAYDFDCGSADRLQLGDQRYSSDGKRVAKPVEGGVRIELRADQSEWWTIPHPSAWPERFSPDGRWLLSSSPVDTIVWDLLMRAPQLSIAHSDGALKELAWSSQDNRLALRIAPNDESKQESVEVWDVIQAKKIFGPTLVKRKASIHLAPLALSENGTLLAVPEDSDVVHTYELSSGGELYHTNENRSAWIFGIGYGPRSNTLGIGSSDLTIRQYEGRRRNRARPDIQLPDVAPFAIGYSPDERWLITCSNVKRNTGLIAVVNLFSTRDSELLATLGPLSISSETGSILEEIHSEVWLSSNGKRVIVHQPLLGLTCQWVIRQYNAPFSELNTLAKLFTNVEMDPSGNLSAIDPNEWLNNPEPYRKAWRAWRETR